MDSHEMQEERGKNEKAHASVHRIILRSCFAFAFSFLILLLILFIILYLAVLIGNLSIWSPISVPSQCRIVSSSVDLKSTKVCELGLLNYKAKHVFYPFERKRYRCHYDYYWASIFKVEYVDHSGQARFAFAEAPNEALPSNCRPNFGAAWLTKDKFKVNETYQCWYTLGIAKVSINHDGLFDCQAQDPSTVEMLKRYSLLFIRMSKSWFSNRPSIRWWRWDMIAGLIAGLITSFFSITLAAFLRQLITVLYRVCASRMSLPYPIHMRRHLQADPIGKGARRRSCLPSNENDEVVILLKSAVLANPRKVVKLPTFSSRPHQLHSFLGQLVEALLFQQCSLYNSQKSHEMM